MLWELTLHGAVGEESGPAAEQHRLVRLPVLPAHDHVDDGVDAGGEVAQDVAQDVQTCRKPGTGVTGMP